MPAHGYYNDVLAPRREPTGAEVPLSPQMARANVVRAALALTANEIGYDYPPNPHTRAEDLSEFLDEAARELIAALKRAKAGL